MEAGLAALSPKLREALLVVEVLGYRYREAAIILRPKRSTRWVETLRARHRDTFPKPVLLLGAGGHNIIFDFEEIREWFERYISRPRHPKESGNRIT